MIWEDISNNSKKLKWGIYIGRMFIMIELIRSPKFRTSIYKLSKSIPNNDIWILKCSNLGLDQELTSNEVESAKNEAIAIVKNEIETKLVYLQEQLDYFQ